MKCPHSNCTGKHSGKWRIAELCPRAQALRRASWRAYDGNLHEAHVRSYAARFGEPGTEVSLPLESGERQRLTVLSWQLTKRMQVRNPNVRLDVRSSKRALYKYLWAVRKRIAQAEEKIAESF